MISNFVHEGGGSPIERLSCLLLVMGEPLWGGGDLSVLCVCARGCFTGQGARSQRLH